jgi:hypothetical protein
VSKKVKGEFAKAPMERFRAIRALLGRAPLDSEQRLAILGELRALEQQVAALEREKTDWMNATALLGRKMVLPERHEAHCAPECETLPSHGMCWEDASGLVRWTD